jgi:hypothetical protein
VQFVSTNTVQRQPSSTTNQSAVVLQAHSFRPLLPSIRQLSCRLPLHVYRSNGIRGHGSRVLCSSCFSFQENASSQSLFVQVFTTTEQQLKPHLSLSLILTSCLTDRLLQQPSNQLYVRFRFIPERGTNVADAYNLLATQTTPNGM